MAKITISLTKAPHLGWVRGPEEGGPGISHFLFPTQDQRSRTPHGPKKLIGIFLSRCTCKQVTGRREVAWGVLIDEQLSGVTPGTAICSHSPQTCHSPPPTQTGIPKAQVKGQGPWDPIEGSLTWWLFSVQPSHTL